MRETNMGGPAFPVPEIEDFQSQIIPAQFQGMTLWDYYAAAALGGLCAADNIAYPNVAAAASDAAAAADALLAKRRKRMEEPNEAPK